MSQAAGDDASVRVNISNHDWKRIVLLVAGAGMTNVGLLLTWVWHADRRIGLLEERDTNRQQAMSEMTAELRELVKNEIRPMRDDLQRLLGRLSVTPSGGGATGKP
ncbi:MAG: hypothetical protein IOD15_14815 [Phycisphaerales bacterium]|nr:hypothetical protein [Phycisphaerales bacterium]